MYLLAFVVLVGAVLVLVRSVVSGRSLQPLQLHHAWLVPAAVVPQLIAFYLPATDGLVPEPFAPLVLGVSQLLILLFVLVNLRQPGLLLIGLGTVLNLLVIVANGGFMPLAPETARALLPAAEWEVGARFAAYKSHILAAETIRLELLADRFLLPGWLPLRAAYSLGDVFIGAGALALLWTMGNGVPQPQARRQVATLRATEGVSI